MSDAAPTKGMVSTAALDLASSLEAPKSTEGDGHALPTALMVCQAGSVLFECSRQSEAPSDASLSAAFGKLMATLPRDYLASVILGDINQAFSSVVASSIDSENEEHLAAVRSVCGLYMHSKAACLAGFNLEHLSTSLARCYDLIAQSDDSRRDHQTVLEGILHSLSNLLLEGLIASHRARPKKGQDDSDDVALQEIMEVVQALTSDSSSCCLGDLQDWQTQNRELAPERLTEAVLKTYPETPQREYLILMLNSCPESLNQQQHGTEKAKSEKIKTKQPKQPPSTKKKTSKKPAVSAQAAIQQRIQQIRDVLPDLGEGFIETALACYSGNVPQTISALLEAEADPQRLHPRLRALDKQLPARRRDEFKGINHYDGMEDDEEARLLQKARVTEMDRQQEQEAYVLTVMGTGGTKMGEYNDDYDDQYDGVGDDGGGAGDIGFADGGMYDVDLETMRTYNRLVRETEAEGSAWEASRNQNREMGSARRSAKAASVQEKEEMGEEGEEDVEEAGAARKYRGQDKAKGGRIIGPDGKYVPLKKGGKKARKEQQQGGDTQDESVDHQSKTESSSSMSKLQKRRKDAKKAKIANHHRKERAQKKMGSGM